MSRTDDQRISDILEACEELLVLASLKEKCAAPMFVLTRAAERLLEIVGEASNALSESARDAFPSVNWRDITRMRIFLAHHYQRVDDAQVWAIVSTSIPALASALRPS